MAGIAAAPKPHGTKQATATTKKGNGRGVPRLVSPGSTQPPRPSRPPHATPVSPNHPTHPTVLLLMQHRCCNQMQAGQHGEKGKKVKRNETKRHVAENAGNKGGTPTQSWAPPSTATDQPPSFASPSCAPAGVRARAALTRIVTNHAGRRKTTTATATIGDNISSTAHEGG